MAKINHVKYDDGIHVQTIKKPESVSYNQRQGLWEIQHQVDQNGYLIRVVTKVKNVVEIEETI